MNANKRVVLSGFNAGDPTSTMSVAEEAAPVPQHGQVLVRLTLRPVNPADIFSLVSWLFPRALRSWKAAGSIYCTFRL
jgi:NADPH:quinone reductase-like Zn-dependent oxidoreductase